MMWDASEGMGWWMLSGSVFWVIFVATVVWLFARAFEGGGGSVPNRPDRSQDPLEIARRRYAAGEVSDEDFRRIRENLKT